MRLHKDRRVWAFFAARTSGMRLASILLFLLLMSSCAYAPPADAQLAPGPNSAEDFEVRMEGAVWSHWWQPEIGIEGGGALEASNFDDRMCLHAVSANIEDQPIQALRFSAMVHMRKGSGKLRAQVVGWDVNGVRYFAKSRQVRPGELPLDKWAPLTLEVDLRVFVELPMDRYGLYLLNEGGGRFALDVMRVTAVTVDVPGRPAHGTTPS